MTYHFSRRKSKKIWYHSVTYKRWGKTIRLHFDNQLEESYVTRVMKRSKWTISKWG